jgi:hypothetical protein
VGTQLRIYWDGQAPGLKEGRLSIATFGPALQALLKAARNIAKRQVAAAKGEAYDPERATKSTFVDLQMSTFKSGSAEPTLDVVPLPTAFGASQLIPDLADSITRELYSSIRDEARGVRRDRFINEYLHLLPKELARQRYSIIRDGAVLEETELREMRLQEVVEEYPAVVLLRGLVDGVKFGERSEPVVIFAPWEGRLVSASATREQVREAIDVQGKAQALILMGARPRLLWIRAEGAPMSTLPPERRDDYLVERWGEALKGLGDE